MAIRSQIEWTEATWNPTTGCTKVSAGCKNCYNASLKKFLFSLNNGAAQTKKIPVDFQMAKNTIKCPLRLYENYGRLLDWL